jgi:acetyl-CoA C-acetyltransferase
MSLSVSIHPKAPCIVGTSRRTWREAAAAPEPLEMWVELARAAAADASVGARAATHHASVLRAIDDLGLVHCQSWHYDDPLARLSDRLELPDARREKSILAGTSPQRLLDGAAVRLLKGETSAALVVGGEALAARRAFDHAGEPPAWSHPHPHPPTLPVDLDEWYLPTEIAHGVLPAWLTFALLEQARWAARGASPSDRDHMGSIMAGLNATAAANLDAWFTEHRSATELTEAGADNRMIATPYTKRMTAFLDVDMAAANLMVTHELADHWGVPPERRVYLRGWGFARDAIHLAERQDLASSGGMRSAISDALSRARLSVADIDQFDLYSCFASAVQFALDALGLDANDPRPLSCTGGLPYHGGPGSNYMSHSISHLVDRLREQPGQVGLVTGVGMHMTKHVAGIWSSSPGSVAVGDDPGPQRWGEGAPAAPGRRTVAERHTGPATVVAASTVHESRHADPYVIAICEIDHTTRCYARSSDPDVAAAVSGDAWVGTTAYLEPSGPINELKL